MLRVYLYDLLLVTTHDRIPWHGFSTVALNGQSQFSVAFQDIAESQLLHCVAVALILLETALCLSRADVRSSGQQGARLLFDHEVTTTDIHLVLLGVVLALIMLDEEDYFWG